MKKIAILFIVLIVFIAGCGRSEEYQEYISNASSAYDNDDFSAAVEWYEKAKAIKPLSEEDGTKYLKSVALVKSQEHYRDGMSAFHQGNYQEASDHLRHVIKTDPDYEHAREKLTESRTNIAESLLQDAKVAYQKGEYKVAYETLRSSSAATTPSYEPAQSLLPQYKAKYDEKVRLEQQEKRKQELAQAREQMKYYQKGTGPVSIAVEVKTSRQVSSSYTTWTAAKNSQFVWVGVSANNEGTGTSHVNPNHFTLSTPVGHTANPDTDCTYSRSNYFDAINLPPGGKSSGWLVFHMPVHDEYMLNFRSSDSAVQKRVIP